VQAWWRCNNGPRLCNSRATHRNSSLTHCNTLCGRRQGSTGTATRCNTLQRTARHCSILPTHCSTPLRHCNTVALLPTHCNTLVRCTSSHFSQSSTTTGFDQLDTHTHTQTHSLSLPLSFSLSSTTTGFAQLDTLLSLSHTHIVTIERSNKYPRLLVFWFVAAHRQHTATYTTNILQHSGVPQQQPFKPLFSARACTHTHHSSSTIGLDQLSTLHMHTRTPPHTHSSH